MRLIGKISQFPRNDAKNLPILAMAPETYQLNAFSATLF